MTQDATVKFSIIIYGTNHLNELKKTFESILADGLPKSEFEVIFNCEDQTIINEIIQQYSSSVNVKAVDTHFNSVGHQKNNCIQNMSAQNKWVLFIRMGNQYFPKSLTYIFDIANQSEVDIIHFKQENDQFNDDYLFHFNIQYKVWKKKIFLKSKFMENRYFEDLFLVNDIMFGEYNITEVEKNIIQNNHKRDDSFNFYRLKDLYSGYTNVYKVISLTKPEYFATKPGLHYIETFVDIICLSYIARIIVKTEFKNKLSLLKDHKLLTKQQEKVMKRFLTPLIKKYNSIRLKKKYNYKQKDIFL